MIEIEKGFWRGYWPLLLALGTAQLTQQADILMAGRLGGGASGAYVMLTRAAMGDVVLMTAMGAVASTAVAQAQRGGETAHVIGQILGLALLAGLCCCAFGLWFYPRVARWLAGEGEVATLIGAGVFWYSLAAPFRFLNNTSAFVLHALGHGGLVVRWKLIEAVAKTAGNFLIMEILGLGFSGCFVTSLIISIISSMWCRGALSPHNARWISVPGYSWALQFLRSSAWEAQRIISAQLAALTYLTLYAAPWLGKHDVSRFNSYAAGQTLALVVFVPFMALIPVLAFRLSTLPDDRFDSSLRTLWLQGAPIVAGAALILLVSHERLGRLYGQHGPWWSMLIQALAISLPLRFAANVMRAISQSRRAFAAVAAVDSAAAWLLATPLITVGLYVDSPAIAYLSLILPEAACAVWLWRRLHLSRHANSANART
jgi:hypothetical protein